MSETPTAEKDARSTGAFVPERQRCICGDDVGCVDHCRACNYSGRDLEELCIADPDWEPDDDDLERRMAIFREADETDHAEPFCVPSGWVDAKYIPHTLGEPFRLLIYPDGVVRFEHRCDRGKRGVIICAPALQIGNGHTLTWAPNNYPGYEGLFDVPTVTPSISCPDCGTHGFITNGRWADA